MGHPPVCICKHTYEIPQLNKTFVELGVFCFVVRLAGYVNGSGLRALRPFFRSLLSVKLMCAEGDFRF